MSEKTKQISVLINATAETFGQNLSPQAVFMMAQDLQNFDIAGVAEALARVRRECSRLTLKEVLDRLAQAGGWLSSDEAWAVAIEAQDERATVVWTQESAKAFAECRALLHAGDKIGARMAFKAAYERNVAQASMNGGKPQPFVSEGFDPNLRHGAVQKAVEQGRIGHSAALPYEPAPALAWNPQELLAGTGSLPTFLPKQYADKFAQIRAAIKARNPDEERAKRAFKARERLDERKAYFDKLAKERMAIEAEKAKEQGGAA